jgi:large subunit ribosomal protein L17
MRHRLAGRHLGRDTAHRVALYRNLVTDLLRYERITTTEAKAKEIRPMAEKIITLGRRGDLHARRQALRFVYDPKVVKKVFDDIGPRMKERPGGYLRITALEARRGDGAKMAAIELVDLGGESAPAGRRQSQPRPAGRRSNAAAAAPGAAAAAAAPTGIPATGAETAAEEADAVATGEEAADAVAQVAPPADDLAAADAAAADAAADAGNGEAKEQS